RPLLISILFITLFGSLLGGAYLTNSIIHADTPTNAPPVLTYKYDTFRSGQNPNETILNTSNVTSSKFGKRVSYPVDGFVYAQPLYVPNLTINGQSHNVVFVATAHDSVYAFDADQRQATAPLWHASFINPPSVVPINGT